MAWYSLELEEVLEKLNADPNKGLSSSEVEERLARFGSNTLREERKKTIFERFLEQFKDVMIVILMAAAAIS
ncbi:cation-transporting P-type ATPase, partial [Mesotoga sp. HF07.pep.5.2.highcov]